MVDDIPLTPDRSETSLAELFEESSLRLRPSIRLGGEVSLDRLHVYLSGFFEGQRSHVRDANRRMLLDFGDWVTTNHGLAAEYGWSGGIPIIAKQKKVSEMDQFWELWDLYRTTSGSAHR